MSAVAELAPWLIIILIIVICELSKDLREARKNVREAIKQLAEADAFIARIRADRDGAEASLRRVCAAFEKQARPIPATDQTGQPFALEAWKPESKPS